MNVKGGDKLNFPSMTKGDFVEHRLSLMTPINDKGDKGKIRDWWHGMVWALDTKRAKWPIMWSFVAWWGHGTFGQGYEDALACGKLELEALIWHTCCLVMVWLDISFEVVEEVFEALMSLTWRILWFVVALLKSLVLSFWRSPWTWWYDSPIKRD